MSLLCTSFHYIDGWRGWRSGHEIDIPVFRIAQCVVEAKIRGCGGRLQVPRLPVLARDDRFVVGPKDVNRASPGLNAVPFAALTRG